MRLWELACCLDAARCCVVLLGREKKAAASSDRLWGPGQGRHHPPHSKHRNPSFSRAQCDVLPVFAGTVASRKRTSDQGRFVKWPALFPEPRNPVLAVHQAMGCRSGSEMSHSSRRVGVAALWLWTLRRPAALDPFVRPNPQLRGSRHQTRNLEIRGSRPPPR